MGSNVAVFEFGTIAVYTLPLRFNRPNTATLPAAPRPRLSLAAWRLVSSK